MDAKIIKLFISSIESRIDELKESIETETNGIVNMMLHAKLTEQQATLVAIQDFYIAVLKEDIQNMNIKISN